MFPENFFVGFTAISILGVIGGAIRWGWVQLTGRIDRRAAELDAREKAFEETRDNKIKLLEERIAHLSGEMQRIRDTVSKQRTAISLLVAKIARDEPAAPELALVEKLLGDEFPGFLRIDDTRTGLPRGMADLARGIDCNPEQEPR